MATDDRSQQEINAQAVKDDYYNGTSMAAQNEQNYAALSGSGQRTNTSQGGTQHDREEEKKKEEERQYNFLIANLIINWDEIKDLSGQLGQANTRLAEALADVQEALNELKRELAYLEQTQKAIATIKEDLRVNQIPALEQKYVTLIDPNDPDVVRIVFEDENGGYYTKDDQGNHVEIKDPEDIESIERQKAGKEFAREDNPDVEKYYETRQELAAQRDAAAGCKDECRSRQDTIKALKEKLDDLKREAEEIKQNIIEKLGGLDPDSINPEDLPPEIRAELHELDELKENIKAYEKNIDAYEKVSADIQGTSTQADRLSVDYENDIAGLNNDGMSTVSMTIELTNVFNPAAEAFSFKNDEDILAKNDSDTGAEVWGEPSLTPSEDQAFYTRVKNEIIAMAVSLNGESGVMGLHDLERLAAEYGVENPRFIDDLTKKLKQENIKVVDEPALNEQDLKEEYNAVADIRTSANKMSGLSSMNAFNAAASPGPAQDMAPRPGPAPQEPAPGLATPGMNA